MERFDTSISYHTWYEHWHRYYFIVDFIEGKNICDLACGEGYGSSLLAMTAKSVIGVDIDKNTIASASKKYQNNNLKYIQSDALNTPFEDNQFDVVVSFETLEHLAEHQQLLEEFSRILKYDGLLIISTPDIDVYSSRDDHNEFHIKELSAEEFSNLIDENFNHQITYGQQFHYMSVIESHDNNLKTSKILYLEEGNETVVSENKSKPTYLIKFCSNTKEVLQDINEIKSHGFCDSDNQILSHYDEQIRRLLKIDKQNLELTDIVKKQNTVINHLKARLGI